MKSTILLLTLGLSALALSGCETNNRGGVYDRAINEGPVGRGPVIVDNRQPDYRDDRGPRGRYDGRDDRNDRRDGRSDRYDRRDDCRAGPNDDPRYSRCYR